jgi:hypothetical protein
MTDKNSTLHKRLFAKLQVRLGECWLWTGATCKTGLPYGRIRVWVDGRWTHRLVHCVTYEVFRGPIPEGMTLDHLCRQPSCGNPFHTEPVTLQVNILRGTSPVAQQARQESCKRGHPLSGSNLYVYPDGRRGCRACTRWHHARYQEAV